MSYRIVAGSYERFLFGFECSDGLLSEEDKDAQELVRRHTFAAHKV